MENEKAKKFNAHAKFMADIALEILKGNKNVLDVNGIKEIIALYLLIPYITPDTLQTPGSDYVIPKLTGDFCGGITLEDLRNAICHSFVTTEKDLNDGSLHGKMLILDDRVIHHNRKTHKDLGEHSSAYFVLTSAVHSRLLELFTEIQNQ